MSEPVIEVVTECVHGLAMEHWHPDTFSNTKTFCKAGFRVRYTRQKAIAKLAIALIVTEVTDKRRGANATRAVDALLGETDV